ncbi:MarR family winged helix-turn-helix transcriptional regulator [Falsiroseomonas sp. HW251]|uniref:MarR family winged helix-turn-helix transcriptional regulator n=1 Tax=Falsiroseomonas sp. HW251 TaxID=3390998 RepID=UPI003D3179AF
MESSEESRAEKPPYVGALLRLCSERARERVHQAIREAGCDDLHETHLRLFTYPVPDGVRPSEIARRLGMTRQATNHVITQMEALGYLERRDGPDGRRLVYLTARTWTVAEAIWKAMRDLQSEWRAEIGERDFETFIAVLRRLAAAAAPAPAAAAPAASPRS